jgi:hypothetical protein
MSNTINNPLRQFFRRPALYLKLPSNGVGYSDGAIDFPDNGELPIYPMTAIDEITSRTPDALFNGVAVTEIIKSCVPSIKDPWQVLSIDLDAILIAIRIATNGQAMEIDSTCPACNEDSKFDVNLSGLLGTLTPGDYSTPVKLMDDLSIKFKPLNYQQISKASERQFEISKLLNEVERVTDIEERNTKSGELMKILNELAIQILIETIEYIKTPDAIVFEKEFIAEFLTNCDKKTHNFLKEKNSELRQTTELKPLHITCSHCSHEHDQSFNINISDFFD